VGIGFLNNGNTALSSSFINLSSSVSTYSPLSSSFVNLSSSVSAIPANLINLSSSVSLMNTKFTAVSSSYKNVSSSLDDRIETDGFIGRNLELTRGYQKTIRIFHTSSIGAGVVPLYTVSQYDGSCRLYAALPLAVDRVWYDDGDGEALVVRHHPNPSQISGNAPLFVKLDNPVPGFTSPWQNSGSFAAGFDYLMVFTTAGRALKVNNTGFTPGSAVLQIFFDDDIFEGTYGKPYMIHPSGTDYTTKTELTFGNI